MLISVLLDVADLCSGVFPTGLGVSSCFWLSWLESSTLIVSGDEAFSLAFVGNKEGCLIWSHGHSYPPWYNWEYNHWFGGCNKGVLRKSWAASALLNKFPWGWPTCWPPLCKNAFKSWFLWWNRCEKSWFFCINSCFLLSITLKSSFFDFKTVVKAPGLSSGAGLPFDEAVTDISSSWGDESCDVDVRRSNWGEALGLVVLWGLQANATELKVSGCETSVNTIYTIWQHELEKNMTIWMNNHLLASWKFLVLDQGRQKRKGWNAEVEAKTDRVLPDGLVLPIRDPEVLQVVGLFLKIYK